VLALFLKEIKLSNEAGMVARGEAVDARPGHGSAPLSPGAPASADGPATSDPIPQQISHQ
jgi:hypothetical protein